MKEEIDFTKVPYQYAMCLNRKCSKANTCLRQLTEQSVPEKIEYWDIPNISPLYKEIALTIVLTPKCVMQKDSSKY